MKRAPETAPERGAEPADAERHRGPRISLIGLSVCVVLAVVVASLNWMLTREAGSAGDPLGGLIWLGLITVTGAVFGLVALIQALVNYGRQHSPLKAVGVLCLGVAVLVVGGNLILSSTQRLDPYYREQRAREQASSRTEQQWRAREQYPSCGTVVVTPRLAPTEFGPAEFRCMRRANAGGEPAELQVVRKDEDVIWYVRTNPDRTVEVFTYNGPASGTSMLSGGSWRHRTCTQDQVLLQNPKAVCRGVAYYGW